MNKCICNFSFWLRYYLFYSRIKTSRINWWTSL